MSRQLLLSGHTIRCDVGYGLAAGDGERVAVTPIAVALAVDPAVGIPVGPVGERGLDILAARVGNGGVVPAVADSLHGHVVGGLRTGLRTFSWRWSRSPLGQVNSNYQEWSTHVV